MKLYAVRKRRGQWTVCSDEIVLLHFESYDEAIRTARSAVEVLSNRSPGPSFATPKPHPMVPSNVGRFAFNGATERSYPLPRLRLASNGERAAMAEYVLLAERNP